MFGQTDGFSDPREGEGGGRTRTMKRANLFPPIFKGKGGYLGCVGPDAARNTSSPHFPPAAGEGAAGAWEGEWVKMRERTADLTVSPVFRGKRGETGGGRGG